MPDVFQVLADPTRRHLLEALRTGERSVLELVQEARISQPAVSKQLRLLREAGLVNMRKAGRQHLYTIRGVPLQEASEWLKFYEQFWEEGLDRMQHLLSQNPRSKKEGRS